MVSRAEIFPLDPTLAITFPTNPRTQMCLMFGTLVFLLAVAPAHSRITGFSLDIEPSAGNESVALVEYLSEFRWRISGTGLKLSADAGTAWSSSDFMTNVNGTSKVLAEWLVELCNETVVMSYDRNGTNLLVRVDPYLAYADTYGERNVTVGVAIASPGSTPTWWQTQSPAELEALIEGVDPSLRQHASFKGRYAVFFAATLFNASAGGGPPPGSGIGEEKALWYVDDDWVYDATAQSAFFQFAAAQNVRELYDAPHAGNRPHIGANTTDQALYVDFVHLADAQGIDIQFMSGLDTLAYDLAFIESVNGGATS